MDVMNITTLISSWGLSIPVVISERINPSFHKIPKLYSWLRFKVYPFCYRLIVQTQGAANYFPLSFQKFTCIIPNPVEMPRDHKKSFPKEVKRIVAIGRLEHQKDHETLIRAFSKISNDYPELILSIYGEGSGRKKIERLIQDLELQEKIFLSGIVNDVNKILMDAELFIHPSRYEGFPNALCEAMAVGLPVIVSDCTGNIDVVRGGIDGRIFPVGDVEELRQVTLELLSNLNQRKYLARNAQDICDRFNSDRIFTLWDEVINGVNASGNDKNLQFRGKNDS
jgi:glycosyltransferase involved in cell wall biosynthesis